MYKYIHVPNLKLNKKKRNMGGTEAFPELGSHCEHAECNRLDFLPFNCSACHRIFCLDHRSFKSHQCSKSDHNSRKVIVCEVCSSSIEITGVEDQKLILQKHLKSTNCDPAKNKKPRCPVNKCKEKLTFSNSATCKTCHLKVCLKHRFSSDHDCIKASSLLLASVLVDFKARKGTTDCGNTATRPSSSLSNPSVKAY